MVHYCVGYLNCHLTTITAHTKIYNEFHRQITPQKCDSVLLIQQLPIDLTLASYCWLNIHSDVCKQFHSTNQLVWIYLAILFSWQSQYWYTYYHHQLSFNYVIWPNNFILCVSHFNGCQIFNPNKALMFSSL